MASAAALFGQAAALQRAGQRDAAIARFREALQTDGSDPERWYEFGYLLKAGGRYADAMQAFGEALARGIARAEEVHLNRAVLCVDHLRRDAEAERELEAALALAPRYVPALFNLANLHALRGRRDAALETYARVIDAGSDPRHPYHELALEALARSAAIDPPATLEDGRLARLDAAADVAREPRVRANLLFTLGRSRDRLGDWDRAFDAFARGNRTLLRQAGRGYRRDLAGRETEALIEAFPRSDDITATSASEAGPEPLFVCGMFRSGSTLVEQVLGTHPDVVAGGELNFLLRLAGERLAPFPASVATLDATRCAALAAEYRAHLATLYPESATRRYVTDKRPDNYPLIGLIKRLFPRAKIVHTTRHPLDNGLSIFMQHLVPRVAAYACDLGDIGHHYGQYRRLMAHWNALWPDDIFEVRYDELVREPEATLRGLFAFLGLPWDPRCLEFHTRDNTVRTASYLQVRRPLYREASGRWRHYVAHLQPLREALLAAGIDARELA